MFKGTTGVGRGPQFDSFSDIVKIDWSLRYISERISTTHILAATFVAFMFILLCEKKSCNLYTIVRQFFSDGNVYEPTREWSGLATKPKIRCLSNTRWTAAPHTNI